MRRTQRERRETTRARLLDASLEVIAEVGHTKASAKAIAARARRSDGALFRHFDTMTDLMVATAEEAFRRQIDEFVTRFAALPPENRSIEEVLQLQYEMSGNAINAVIYELLLAARTDEKFGRRLRPVLQEYGAAMLRVAKETVGATLEIDPLDFATVVFMVTDMFDAERIFQHLRPQPELVERRLRLLHTMLDGLVSAAEQSEGPLCEK